MKITETTLPLPRTFSIEVTYEELVAIRDVFGRSSYAILVDRKDLKSALYNKFDAAC